jgi:mRNA interferase RelE/StbE
MARYELVFRKSVPRDFRPIPKKHVVFILQRIEALREELRPVGKEKLSGKERYRLRQGVYRIIYEVAEDQLIVTMAKVAHRRHVHRGG